MAVCNQGDLKGCLATNSGVFFPLKVSVTSKKSMFTFLTRHALTGIIINKKIFLVGAGDSTLFIWEEKNLNVFRLLHSGGTWNEKGRDHCRGVGSAWGKAVDRHFECGKRQTRQSIMLTWCFAVSGLL